MNTNPDLQTLASIYDQYSTCTGAPEPLGRDKLGRLIFEDGSWLDVNALGQTLIGQWDVAEWREIEFKAHTLGKSDRVLKRKMRRAFRDSTRNFPKRICKAYRDGLFSIASWPRKTS